MKHLIFILILFSCSSVKIEVGNVSAFGSYKSETAIYANQYIIQNLILNSDSTYEFKKIAAPIPTISKGTWNIKNNIIKLTPYDEYFPDDERDSSFIDSLRKTTSATVNPDGSIEFKEGVPRRNNSMYVVSIKAYGDFVFKTDSICYSNGIYSNGCFIKEKN